MPREQVIENTRPTHNWIKEWNRVNAQDTKQSPEISKKGKSRMFKSPQSTPPEVLKDFPHSLVRKGMGITDAVAQFLEVSLSMPRPTDSRWMIYDDGLTASTMNDPEQMSEVMGQMNHLFSFSHANPHLTPYAALDQYVATHITNMPPVNVNGVPAMAMMPAPHNGVPMGFAPTFVGASPAAAHLQLGGPMPGPGGGPVGGPMGASLVPGNMPPPPNQPPGTNVKTDTSPPGKRKRSDNTTPVMNQANGPPGKPKQSPRTKKRRSS